MIRLLTIELLKIRNYRTFWVIFSLYAVALTLLMWILYGFTNQMEGKVGFTAFTIYSFPDVWSNTTYFALFLRFLIGFLMIILVSNEFSYKTIRQGIIDGLSKEEWILSKILLALFLSTVAAGIVFLIASIFGLVSSKSSDYEYFFKYISYIPTYLLEVFVYLMFAFMVTIFFKRSGLSMIIVLFYSFFEWYWVIKFKSEGIEKGVGKYLQEEDHWALNKFPFNTPLDLTNPPFKKYGVILNFDADITLVQCLPALGYSLLFGAIAYFWLKNKDI